MIQKQILEAVQIVRIRDHPIVSGIRNVGVVGERQSNCAYDLSTIITPTEEEVAKEHGYTKSLMISASHHVRLLKTTHLQT